MSDRRWIMMALASLAAGCGSDHPAAHRPSLAERVDDFLEQMTLEEKIEQMHGTSFLTVNGLYLTAENSRLGIPGFAMVDGPRGVRAGNATTFPVGIARGATWDRELEERVGRAMGSETAAKGGNVLLAPTINVLRHPAWGRAQETYGEEPFHLGEMGAAFVAGAQEHVISVAKHYALNSIEETRFDVDVQVDERTLREIYLPHFKKAIDRARVGSVMSAYNRVNGEYCAENFHLLHDILKGEWGFDGFVVSDWVLGTRSTVASALAGLDVEMPTGAYFGEDLIAAVTNGDVPMDVIDDSVRRILLKKLEHGLDRLSPPSPEVVESAAHTALALEVARKSMVLLKNDGLLPLDRAGTTTLAVVGELADTVNLGDNGSSNSVPSYAVTPLQGLRDLIGAERVRFVPGPTLDANAETEIAAADAALVVVGLTAVDEGEYIPPQGGDRENLGLSAEHDALISAVLAQNPRTIVVLEGGSALTLGSWLASVPALLMAWYPGQEGGRALAEIVFGEVNPSGKLPLSFHATDDQLPLFDNTSAAVVYDYWHGYRLLDRDGKEPAFPFGFGLSYTTFSYDSLVVAERAAAGQVLFVYATVTNTGAYAGEEIVQLYVGYEGSAVERPLRELRSFERVRLWPGNRQSVRLELPTDELSYFDVDTQSSRIEPITYRVWVGPSSRDLPLEGRFTIEP